jgi:cyclophilin family peptidyl-prolyl cis-trans isomerase
MESTYEKSAPPAARPSGAESLVPFPAGRIRPVPLQARESSQPIQKECRSGSAQGERLEFRVEDPVERAAGDIAMWDRIRVVHSQVKRHTEETGAKLRRRSARQPLVEILEARQLLAGMASLQPITPQTVPVQQGLVIPLLAASSTTDPQTFTVTSSQPNIVGSIVQGPFWNVGVSSPANGISGTLTFQLFPQYTPNTVNMITAFTNDKYYVDSGMFWPRIITNFGGSGSFVLQGGSATENGTGSSGQPGTPFETENVQQLINNGTNQLSMASENNSTNTNRDTVDTQFFINTGPIQTVLSPPEYGFTIFGQLVSGQATLAKMETVPVTTNTVTGEHSQPLNPITITSTTFSSTDPNGVLLIDTSHTTTVGEQATITVTATDSVNHTTATQSFTVTTSAYSGPTDPPINFAPFANPVTATTTENAATTVQLKGVSGYPDTKTPATLTYQELTQPSHGTVTNFNASTGTFTYTPDINYTGPDSFTYQVSSTGPRATPATLMSLPATVSITVGPTNTHAVQVVDQALVVTPVPRFNHGTNKIEVAQVPDAAAMGGAVIQVVVNGQLDQVQPAIGTLDRIIVFGGARVNNDIVIDPSVTLPTTIDGGHGRVNYLTGGGGETREHGWFGFTTLIGGPGTNQLIGLKGRVHFKPSKATNIIFAGVPRRRSPLLNPIPPGGTFYKFINGHLVPIVSVDPTPAAHDALRVDPGGPMRKTR